MKPRVIDRILLVLMLLFTLVVAAFLLAVATHLLPAEYVLFNATLAYSGLTASLIIGGAGLVVLILSVRLMVAFNRRPSVPRVTSALVAADELGSTHIALAAVDHLVQRHCRTNGKIKECVSSIYTTQDGGLRVGLKLVVLPETNVPEFTSELKASLKAYLEEYTGIPVRDISILISAAAQNAYKPSGE
ncbi:MAG: alkaline shock response membrane anchor protein AmaP [Clostridiaceae bacterium]|nr:alkaline shock response membrane anchor protein AmaP [Eubacteriales bacterium]